MAGSTRSTARAADVEAFRLAKRILDEGHVLFVFPEGTRSPTGRSRRRRDGVAVLALRTGAPIVPSAIAGSYERLAAGPEAATPGWSRHGPRRRPVPPRRRAAAGHWTAEPPRPSSTTLIMQRIAALLPRGQRGLYGSGAARTGFARDRRPERGPVR